MNKLPIYLLIALLLMGASSAWFNVSMSQKYPINCSGMNNGIPIVINGSAGVTIDGVKQTIWSICAGSETGLYFNSKSVYEVANETNLLEWEVEVGNGTSSTNYHNLWSNYTNVYHFAGNGYTSTATGNNGSVYGSPVYSNSMVGKSLEFDGSTIAVNTRDAFGLQVNNVTNGYFLFFLASKANGTGRTHTTLNPFISEVRGGYTYAYGVDATPIQFFKKYHKVPSETLDPYQNGTNLIPYNASLMLGFTWERGVTMSLIFNNTLETNASGYDLDSDEATPNRDQYMIGKSVDNSSKWFNGTISEARFSIYPAYPDLINMIYQNFIGSVGYGSAGTLETPAGNFTINVINPPDGDHDSSQTTINLSCSPATGGYTLFFDSFNPPTTKRLDNSTNSTWTTNVTTSATYYYTGYCGDSTGISTNFSTRTWIYDTSLPSAVLLNGSEINTANYSLQNPYDGLTNFSINFSDNSGVFAVQFLMYNSTGLFYNYTNISTGNPTSFVWNTSIQTTPANGFPVGRYAVNISVADSHTAQTIPDYSLIEKSDALVFATENNIILEVKAEGADKATAFKEPDKYSFEFNYPVVKDEVVADRVFDVKVLDDSIITYLPDSRYKAHFVFFNPSTFKGNWLDFEGEAGEPIVQKVADNEYRVIFKAVEITGEPLLFQSLGGLNQVDYYYSVYVGNYTINTPQNLSGTTGFVWLNVSKDASSTFSSVVVQNSTLAYSLSNSTAGVYTFFNGTIPTMTAGIYSYYFNMTGTNPDSSTFSAIFPFTLNSTYWEAGICNTSISGVLLNTTFFNENIPSIWDNASMELELFVWAGTTSNNMTFNFNFSTNEHNYTICKTNNTNLTSNLYLKFYEINGFTNRYYWFERALNNSKIDLMLYVYNYTTGVSNLKITARDEQTYQYFPNVLAVLERRYLGEGIYRVVQMDLSDDYGLLFFNVLEENTDYRIRFYDTANNLLKESNNLKFVCDAGICDLTALINPEGESITYSNITWVYTYNNNTGILNVSFLDLNNDTTYFRVWVGRQNFNRQEVICNANLTGNSGSYACNLSTYTGEVLLKVGSSSSPERDLASVWIKINRAVANLGTLLSSGQFSKDGALLSAILFVIIALIGVFSIIGAVIMGVAGFITLYALGLFNALNMGVIVVAVVVAVLIAFKVRR